MIRLRLAVLALATTARKAGIAALAAAVTTGGVALAAVLDGGVTRAELGGVAASAAGAALAAGLAVYKTPNTDA